MRYLNSMDMNGEADEIETLQTDVMRFMAIIAFSLLVIFIPLAKEMTQESEVNSDPTQAKKEVKKSATLTFKSDNALKELLKSKKIAIYLYDKKTIKQIVLTKSNFTTLPIKEVNLSANTFFMPLESMSGSLHKYLKENILQGSDKLKIYIKFNDTIYQNIINTYKNNSYKNHVIDSQGKVNYN